MAKDRKRRKTPSFVLTLKLNTTKRDSDVLMDRFFAAFLMQNRLISHARKRLGGMRQDKRYRALMAERASYAGKTDPASKKEIGRIGDMLSAVRMEYGLSEYQFHSWIATQQRKHEKKIDSLTAQKLATAVWRSVEAVLFRKGKSVHFKKLSDMYSVEGKNNASGIRFKDGRVHWLGLEIQPQIRRGDAYAREALTHRVKYCRIVRKPCGTTFHWYIQLVLEGIPPMKQAFLPKGRVGCDQGTSTEAFVSEKGCILTELCPERPDIQKQVRRIQRRMDRSSRATNPDNYKEDGTPKRGVKWVRSKGRKRDRMKLKTLYRKAADTASQSRERLANAVLTGLGSDIYTEEMDYKALQKRARETAVSEKTGRYKKKKRFGKSIASHAPAAFMCVLERKLGYMGKTVHFVDTKNYKASRYRHDTDEYEEHSLSDREKFIDGHHVQRDLYSAFLLMCAKDTVSPDRELCCRLFPKFIKNQEAELLRLLNETRKHPSCMGLDRFQYLLRA